MLVHPVDVAARCAIRSHDAAAVCLFPALLLAGVVLHSAALGVLCAAAMVALSGWARWWYTSIAAQATLAAPAGRGVIVECVVRGGMLTELTIDTGSRVVTMLAWSPRPALPSEAVTVHGDPDTGRFAVISDQHVYLSALPRLPRRDPGVTRARTPKLSGGDGPRVGGRNRTRH